MTTQQLVIAYIGSNVAALLLLYLSWKRKNTARLLFAVLFIWASVTNWRTANSNPTVYLEYSEYAIGIYQKIIQGYFARHITGIVSLIAAGQLLIGLGMLARGIIVRVCCAGGIIFLLAIAPLGFGSAFPFSITASIALFLLYRHRFTKDILKNKWWV